jgi:hypothetical protein
MIKKRILKTKIFSKWLKKSDFSDQDILTAVGDMEQGLYADLGGNVYKKPVAIGNRGRSQGARNIVATKLGSHWFFLYGFEKNVRANINNVKLAHFQIVAASLLDLTVEEIDSLILSKTLTEVKYVSSKK